jgi:maleylpyruvate isomerase
LLSADPFLRAQTRALAELVNSGVQPLQNLSVLQHVDALGADKIAWGRYWIQRGLDRMAQAVEATAGQFCVGDSVSLADLCLIPQLYNARRFGCDSTAWATLKRIEETCVARPAFIAAEPSNQVDAQG